MRRIVEYTPSPSPPRDRGEPLSSCSSVDTPPLVIDKDGLPDAPPGIDLLDHTDEDSQQDPPHVLADLDLHLIQLPFFSPDLLAPVISRHADELFEGGFLTLEEYLSRRLHPVPASASLASFCPQTSLMGEPTNHSPVLHDQESVDSQASTVLNDPIQNVKLEHDTEGYAELYEKKIKIELPDDKGALIPMSIKPDAKPDNTKPSPVFEQESPFDRLIKRYSKLPHKSKNRLVEITENLNKKNLVDKIVKLINFYNP